MTDAQLVGQALGGRPEAYGELARRWAGRVLAVCHARVGRADAAEDLAQDTLLRGYRALSSLSHPERFGAWLQGIALRACLDWLKDRDRRVLPFSALAPDDRSFDALAAREHPDGPALDREEQRSLLLRAVDELPVDCRTAVLLYYYQDVTYRELAESLGVSPATVNARLTRARALLRERLSGVER